MDLNALKTDSTLSASGVWLEYEDARLKIASATSPAYKRAIAQAVRTLSQRQQRDPGELQRVTAEAMAKHILLDFQGLTERGKPLANTPENRAKILAIEPLRDWIALQAQDLSNFQREEDDAALADIKSEPAVAAEA